MTTQEEEMSRKLGLGPHRKWMPWRTLLAVGLVALGIIGWAVYARLGADQNVRYITEPVTRSDLEVVVSANGTVEPTDMFEVSSELSGTIRAVHVDFNDFVEKGEVLAELDVARLEATLALERASLASAEANVATAEANLVEAKAAYERGIELEKRGISSRQDFDAKEAAFLSAGAQVKSANALRDVAQASVALAEVDLAAASIRSPVKGVVLDRAYDPGQIVAATLSAPVLFTIAEDLTRMELEVAIDEADIGSVEIGQTASFTVDAYDDREFSAEISQVRLAPETLDGVVTYMGILIVQNTDMALRPGMTATADITVASIKDALTVPNAALRFSPPQETEASDSSGSGLVGMVMPRAPSGKAKSGTHGRSVWVLRDGVPVEIDVEIGDSNGNQTVILSGDLGEGDMVIVDRIDGD
ncbi:efflux RND transporter periplasmic adaptor subunit [Aliishimia ponticola]|uniref:Efflux RND transporter periplasmic adaptor subunit n=1 Tax=Aliishimia ponticola TaxID=2499833 RepID=A0A4S4NBV4_9RHOB|nr:efflux RND transporter periplasmic adaptor subunit [Aliishimia ponticola]THH36904.1 efflux RND transporter periplasmic adaptor subunit [Aliishimia ponticola]